MDERAVVAVAALPLLTGALLLVALQRVPPAQTHASAGKSGPVRAAIRAEEPALQRKQFFRYWVAKEAVLKGEGHGLGFPLDRFEIVLGHDAELATVASLEPQRLRQDWTVRLLNLQPGWPAAVALRGRDWELHQMQAGISTGDR